MTSKQSFDDAATLHYINMQRFKSDLAVLRDLIMEKVQLISRIQHVRTIRSIENDNLKFRVSLYEVGTKAQSGQYIEPQVGYSIVRTLGDGQMVDYDFNGFYHIELLTRAGRVSYYMADSLQRLKTYEMQILVKAQTEYSVETWKDGKSESTVIAATSATKVGEIIDGWLEKISHETGKDLNAILQRTRDEQERRSATARPAPAPGQ